jgi:trans-AT polyketide synthase/acyltransferase/oxidoreductase domain-containing protein
MLSQITINPQQLGASSFRQRYGIKYAYLAGSMYKGISSKEMVVAMGNAGFLSFLGTAGMDLKEIESDIRFIQKQLNSKQKYGANLICDVNHPQREMDTIELFLKQGVTCIEASAFMQVTPALVYYRLRGLHKNSDGRIDCRHKIIAKISRPEVAHAFLSPPTADIVKKLFGEGKISREQAEMASQIAMSYDITVEADSAGHTDQGVALVLLPAIQSLRQQIEQKYQYNQQIHVGLAGGIGTPQAAVAAFMMGADFILTGSINQCTVEAGTSDYVKNMLQEMNVQDTDYAPAGDMFELGAKVQVLKKGVFFPARANKLFMLYEHYDCWEEIPENIKAQIETRYFQKTFAQVWQEVQDYHQRKGQHATMEKAAINPKHKMALVFRWYFSYSTRLAFAGDEKNRVDFQVHVGPALGAFNQWVKGSELESWRKRHVDQIAEKLMQETANLLSSQISKLI